MRRPRAGLPLLLLACAAFAAPAAASQTSRDGHFSLALPPEYVWSLPKYPESTHGHIVAAWEVGGAEPRHLEIAVQSLRYMTKEQLSAPAASSCDRWYRQDELTTECRKTTLSSGIEMSYTIRSQRRGQDTLIGFFDLGGGLVYCLITQVPSGNRRDAAVASFLQSLSTLARADGFQRPPPPPCESDYAPVYENWPRAGDWKCRLTGPEENERVLSPTDEPFNPVARVKECPPGLVLARLDEPREGDLGCVDFSQTTQKLVEQFNHTRVFKCGANERPALLGRDGRGRIFVCKRLKKKPQPDAGGAQP